MTQTQTATREVTILARCQFKNNPKAAGYQVLSSNGVDKYEVHVYNGKATSCNCPAKKPCYHLIGVQAYEDARREQYREFEFQCGSYSIPGLY